MEHCGGLQAPEDGEDDDGFRSQPKILILGEERLKSSNCRSLGLCQQQERQLQGDLVEHLQSYKMTISIQHLGTVAGRGVIG